MYWNRILVSANSWFCQEDFGFVCSLDVFKYKNEDKEIKILILTLLWPDLSSYLRMSHICVLFSGVQVSRLKVEPISALLQKPESWWRYRNEGYQQRQENAFLIKYNMQHSEPIIVLCIITVPDIKIRCQCVHIIKYVELLRLRTIHLSDQIIA